MSQLLLNHLKVDQGLIGKYGKSLPLLQYLSYALSPPLQSQINREEANPPIKETDNGYVRLDLTYQLTSIAYF